MAAGALVLAKSVLAGLHHDASICSQRHRRVGNSLSENPRSNARRQYLRSTGASTQFQGMIDSKNRARVSTTKSLTKFRAKSRAVQKP